MAAWKCGELGRGGCILHACGSIRFFWAIINSYCMTRTFEYTHEEPKLPAQTCLSPSIPVSVAPQPSSPSPRASCWPRRASLAARRPPRPAPSPSPSRQPAAARSRYPAAPRVRCGGRVEDLAVLGQRELELSLHPLDVLLWAERRGPRPPARDASTSSIVSQTYITS